MPVVQMPDDTLVEFPDEMPREQIRDMIASKFPEVNKANREDVETPKKVSAGQDMLRSFGSGLRQGGEALVGAIGSNREMQGDAVEWLMGQLGASPEMTARARAISDQIGLPGQASAPTVEQVQGATKELVGEPHEPQTTAGEFTNTIGQFAPAVAVGPGGVFRKAATAVVPAVMSEAAGQVTEGSEAEPLARFGGAVAGGVMSAGRQATALKSAVNEAPAKSILKQQTDELYGQLRAAGIKYHPDEYGRLVLDLARDVRKKGYRKSTHGEALALIDDLAEDIGKAPDFDDINGLISSIGGKARDAAATGDKTLSSSMDLIANRLRAFEQKAPSISETGMSAPQRIALTKQAREMASRNIKARHIEDAIENAASYQSGFESGLRNQFSNLMRNKKKYNSYSPAEKAAIRDIAKGNFTRNALTSLGRFGIDLSKFGNISAMLPGLAAYAEPAIGGPLLVAGTAARPVSRSMATNAANQAKSIVRMGRGGQRTAQQQLKDERLKVNIRRLIAADAPVRTGTVAPFSE